MELRELSWETINFEGMSRQLCQQMQIIHAFQFLFQWMAPCWVYTEEKGMSQSYEQGGLWNHTEIPVTLNKNFRKCFPASSQKWAVPSLLSPDLIY